MKRAHPIFTALVLILAATGAALANCGNAMESYNSKARDLQFEVSRYANCVANSMGEDDCTTEFRRLQSAQSNFERGVSDYRDECQE